MELQKQISFIDELTDIGNKPKQDYVLRDYQESAVSAGVKHLLSGKKPGIIISVTGSGKSLIIANIAKRLDGHVLIFSPSHEILQQNYNKLLSYNQGVEASIYSASFNSKIVSKCTFATIGSVFRKPQDFSHFQFIIIDECDFMLDAYNSESMFNKFFRAIGNKPMIGLTASSFRLYHNSFGCCLRFITRTNPKIWHSVVYYNQIEDLINQGYVADCKYYSVGEFDVSKIKVNATGADYVDSSMKKYYKEISFDNSVLDVCKRLVNVGRKNILVFTKFIEEAEMLTQDLGSISTIVTGKTPTKERDQIIKDFKNGVIKIVANVGVLTIGFDFPELETVVLARPLRSLRLYYQMIGRAIRPSIYKNDVWIVDMCGSYKRFGSIKNLWLTKDANGNWHYVDKGNNNKAITNVYFN